MAMKREKRDISIPDGDVAHWVFRCVISGLEQLLLFSALLGGTLAYPYKYESPRSDLASLLSVGDSPKLSLTPPPSILEDR